MSKRELASYFRTFFMTLLLITLAVAIIAWVTKNNAEKIPTPEKIKEFKESQIEILIEKYKYQEKINTKNYIINVKLGLIFESQGKFKEAEKEYKKAIDKAPYMIFEPTFLLADLYTKERKFNEALYLINNIKEYADPSLITSKAVFYSKIADQLYKNKLYEESIRQYLNSLYYEEKTTYKKTNVINELPKAYSALADEYIKAGKIPKAMFILAEGIRVTDSPDLMYRLGVIGQNADPENSLQLFEEVARIDPTIINYDVYKQVLLKLINKPETVADPTLTKFYTQKLKLITRFAENNIIYPNDFQLEVLSKSCHTDPFKIRSVGDFEFAIRNNSSTDVSKLYVQIKIYNNYKQMQTIERRIATPSSPLRKGRSTEKIRMKVAFFNKDEFITSPDIKVVVSVKRNERLKRTLIGEFLIPKD